MADLHDIADSPRASACDHPADHLLEAMCPKCGRTVDAVCPECGGNVEASGSEELGTQRPKAKVKTRKATPAECAVCPCANGETVLSRLEFYRRLVLLLFNARNTKFMLGCYLIATGHGFADGVSMTEFAREWGVRKATVSKQCRIICSYLGIPPSRYMRNEEVAQGFKLSNRRPRRLQSPKCKVASPKS